MCESLHVMDSYPRYDVSFDEEYSEQGLSPNQIRTHSMTREGSTDSAWSRRSMTLTSATSEPSHATNGWVVGAYSLSPQEVGGFDYLSPMGSSPISARPRSVSTGSGDANDKSGDRDYCCLYPQCSAKPFARNADLDRHYKQRHTDSSKKAAWYCDYKNCNRRRDPFHRLDHFRDHLRQYHKEGIEKRGMLGSSGSTSGSTSRELRVDTGKDWWRCAKCLKRNSGNGDECEGCKSDGSTKRGRV